MSTTRFPVFGAGGRQEGDLRDTSMDGGAVPTDSPVSLQHLPPTAFLAQPGTILRDRNAEAEQREREFHRLCMTLQPQVTQAQDAKKRAEATVKQWAQACWKQQGVVTRLLNLVQRGSLDHEDSEPGSRRERLATAEALLSECRAELEAAQEELVAARTKVESLTVTP